MSYHGFFCGNERVSLLWEIYFIVQDGLVRKCKRGDLLLLLMVVNFVFVSVAEYYIVEGKRAGWGNAKNALTVQVEGVTRTTGLCSQGCVLVIIYHSWGQAQGRIASAGRL